jgi:hypothetical protein
MSDFFAGRDQRAVADALERAGLAAEYQQIFLDNEVKKKKKSTEKTNSFCNALVCCCGLELQCRAIPTMHLSMAT